MFNYSKDNDNIVTITMDMQGRSANVINEEFGKLWLETLDRLEKEKADIAGVVLTSAKSTFFAGADIDNLYKQTNPQEIFDMCEGLKKQLRRLETLGKPVVAALNGAALGGGLEIALACHYRIKQSKSSFRFAGSWLRFIAWWWRHHSFNKNDRLATSTSLLNRRKKIKSKRSRFSRYRE